MTPVIFKSVEFSNEELSAFNAAAERVGVASRRFVANMQAMADSFTRIALFGPHQFDFVTQDCRRCGLTAREAMMMTGPRPCARPLWPVGFSVPPVPMKGRITEVRS